MTRRAGQIISRGERKWLVRWYVGQDGGQKSYRSKTVHGTKKDAQRFLTGVMRDRDQGMYVAPDKLTLDAHLDDWLESAAHNVSGRSLKNMRSILKKHVRPALGDLQIQKIRSGDVQRMVNSMSKRAGRPLSPRTHQIALSHLSQALRDAIRTNLLMRNVAEGTRLPRRAEGDSSAGQQRERRSLTRDELRAFLTQARGSRFDALWQVMATAGCRPGEALGLKWSDLSPEGVIFRRAVTQDEKSRLILGPIKTRKTRRIPLPRSVRDALAVHKASQREHILKLGAGYDRSLDLFFPNELGGLMSETHLRERYFKPLARRAGITLHKGDGPYLLRHTVVTQLLLAGEAPQAVAERVGDTVQTIMGHYAHAVPGLQEKVTETIAALVFGDS